MSDITIDINYLQEAGLAKNIPANVVAQFKIHYENKDTVMCCHEAIKGIYGDNPTRSNRIQFLRHLHVLDAQEWGITKKIPMMGGPPSKLGHRPADEYELSYKAFKKMLTNFNYKLYDYYFQLEQIIFDYIVDSRKQQQIKYEQEKEDMRKAHELEKAALKKKNEEERKTHEEEKTALEQKNEELKNQIPEHECSVYKFEKDGISLYVGKDQSIDQSRLNTHFREAKNILDQYQSIDVYLAYLSSRGIDITTLVTRQILPYDQVIPTEQRLIHELTPAFNIADNPKAVMECPKCDKVYKRQRKLFKQHVIACTKVKPQAAEQQELAEEDPNARDAELPSTS